MNIKKLKLSEDQLEHLPRFKFKLSASSFITFETGRLRWGVPRLPVDLSTTRLIFIIGHNEPLKYFSALWLGVASPSLERDLRGRITTIIMDQQPSAQRRGATGSVMIMMILTIMMITMVL